MGIGKDTPGRRALVRVRIREVDRLRVQGQGVVEACARAGLPLSTYYYRPRPRMGLERARHVARVGEGLARLRTLHPGDGYRALARRLRAQGLVANHKLVYRICRQRGWLRPRDEGFDPLAGLPPGWAWGR